MKKSRAIVPLRVLCLDFFGLTVSDPGHRLEKIAKHQGFDVPLV